MSDDDLIRRGDALDCFLGLDRIGDVMDYISALPAVQVTVKPLEWVAAKSLRKYLVDGEEIIEFTLKAETSTFYIDCEFDGHNGPLLSIAMVRGDGYSVHVKVNEKANDPWVITNVLPIMDAHMADIAQTVEPNYVGSALRKFLGDCKEPVIIADSPVDIGRFCQALTTGKDGKWQSADFSQMQFIVHNVDCYPTTLEGAVQHNAWWDAMALRTKIEEVKYE